MQHGLEKAIIEDAFHRLTYLIPGRLDSRLGVELLGMSVYTRDRACIFFTVPAGGFSDRFVIFTCPREGDALEFQYVPCFTTFKMTRKQRRRKIRFYEYMLSRSSEVKDAFKLDLLNMNTSRDAIEQLVITHEKRRGLYMRIKKPVEQWSDSCFIEDTAGRFVWFVENSLPFVKAFEHQAPAHC